jgi:hypothetical protein
MQSDPPKSSSPTQKKANTHEFPEFLILGGAASAEMYVTLTAKAFHIRTIPQNKLPL